jgi:hypothetical protein
MIEGDDEEDEERRVPLPNVKSASLAKVLEYCNHYIEDPMTEFVKVKITLFFCQIIKEFVNNHPYVAFTRCRYWDFSTSFLC